MLSMSIEDHILIFCSVVWNLVSWNKLYAVLGLDRFSYINFVGAFACSAISLCFCTHKGSASLSDVDGKQGLN